MKPKTVNVWNNKSFKTVEWLIQPNDQLINQFISAVEDLELERECECSKGSILGKKKKKLRCNCFRPGKG